MNSDIITQNRRTLKSDHSTAELSRVPEVVHTCYLEFQRAVIPDGPGAEQSCCCCCVKRHLCSPQSFYLTGFINIPHVRYCYVLLCFVYILTVVGNGMLLAIIYLARSLHTAKYMIVSNLALMDVCGSTALVPKLLDSFLFGRRSIIYEACLSYMFFVFFFLCMQSWTLVIMSYDRFVAICFPLHYTGLVTAPAVATMLLLAGLAMLALTATSVSFVDRLSFCRSVAVKSFYCDHGSLCHLACNDKSLNSSMASVGFILVLVVPLVLIALSYLCISVALSRIAAGAERLRAIKTCTSHLILVAIFFLLVIGTNVAAVLSVIHPNARIINSSLSHILPALLNPIVYSLKTEEVLSGSFQGAF